MHSSSEKGDSAGEAADILYGICLVDQELKIVEHNQALRQLLGAEVRRGAALSQLAPWLAPLEQGQRWLSCQALGTELQAELELLPEGSALGSGWGLVTLKDVGAQRRTQGALRVSEYTLRALVDASPVAVLILDREMKVTLWNQAAEQITGWAREDVLGQPYPLVTDDQRMGFQGLFARVMRGEGFTGIEVTRQRKDGTAVELWVSTAPMRDADGNVVGAMALLQDITERKRLEKRSAESQKLEALGRLAGGIAHDFNNLLTIILGSAELAVTGDQSAAESLIAIRQAAERAAELTGQLLAFSRRQVLKPRTLVLCTVLPQIVRMLDRVLRDDIEVTLDLAADAGAIHMDQGQLERVLVNLAVNARDAMPAGGRLSIAARRNDHPGSVQLPAGSYVTITVRDTGCGMDEAVKSRLFEPFFTTKEHGTGLGLATVHGIVRQSGGDITATSEPGRGTSLMVRLPYVEVAEAPAAPGPTDVPEGSGLVMLVEDNRAVRQATTAMLEVLGYEVQAASSGRRALEVLKTLPCPRILITDVAMPRMSGVELAQVVKAKHPALPVLFISGNVDDAIERHGIAASRLHFLGKPFTLQALGLAVQRAIDEARAAS